MWVFYMISLPLTVGMVVATLRYFAGPAVPAHVLAVVGYAWLCSLSFVVLVPTDIWMVRSRRLLSMLPLAISGNQKSDVGFFWSWSYWSTFILAWVHGILGFAMACSNTFGLVTGAFLLGFGLSEIPRNIWRNADWTRRLQFLSHKVAKMATKLDHAHQEYCSTIFLQDDALFKPSGGKLGENDMDYDTDNKTMATLRRQLRRAHEEYYRRKRKYLSSFRENRSGTLGSFLDSTASILLAEATLLPSDVDLSLFSNLIHVVGKKEVLVQVAAFVPLMYMCICTYYSLFRIGMMLFYSLTPGQTSSVSLLMICS
nr:unnamed protein product [Digitaria exilis]